ncbi:MAG: HNH endonuclease [Corynebacterium sp.]|nr:HNH endonuclease [Corynebacterium sp.]
MQHRYATMQAAERIFAMDCWQQFGNHNKASVDKLTQMLNCSRVDARNLLLAGELLCHNLVAGLLTQYNIPISSIARIGQALSGLKETRSRFRDLHLFLRRAIDELEEDRAEGIVAGVLRFIREHNTAVNKKNKEAEEAHRRARREQTIKEDRAAVERELAIANETGLYFQQFGRFTTPGSENPGMSMEAVQQRTGLPNYRAPLGTVFLDVVTREAEDNMIVLSGLTTLECLILTNAVRSLIKDLPDELLRLPEREVMGHAARKLLLEHVHTHPKTDRVTTTVVTFAKDLEQNKDILFRAANGKEITADEMLSILAEHGSTQTQIVVDDTGRVISEFEGRLAPKSFRRWHQVETDCCAGCMTDLRLTEHHMVPWAECQETSYDNMVPLCIKCHPIVEKNPENFAVYYDLGYSVMRRPDGRVRATPLSRRFAAVSRALTEKYNLDQEDFVAAAAIRQSLKRRAIARFEQNGGGPNA